MKLKMRKTNRNLLALPLNHYNGEFIFNIHVLSSLLCPQNAYLAICIYKKISFLLYHFSETCSLQSGVLRYVRTTRMVKMAGKDIQLTDDSNDFSVVKELLTVSKYIKLCGLR